MVLLSLITHSLVFAMTPPRVETRGEKSQTLGAYGSPWDALEVLWSLAIGLVDVMDPFVFQPFENGSRGGQIVVEECLVRQLLVFFTAYPHPSQRPC